MPRKILVTDDKPELREWVEEALTEAGYEVVIARNGSECVQKALTERPDLILTDVMMPTQSGLHGLQELRAAHSPSKHIPVIVMSASRNVKELFDNYEIQGFLAKPFTTEELIQKVTSVLPAES